MAWIESHQALGRHPKLLRLAMELRIHKAQALGHLKYLWWWALDYARSGDLSAFTSVEISNAAEWPGEANKFHESLKQTGWIDANCHLHDWEDYAGPWIKSLARQKRYRKATLKLRRRDVTVTSNLTVPNQPNQPNQTNKRILDLPDDLKSNYIDIEAWLAYKKQKGQTYKQLGLKALWKRIREIPPENRKAAIEQSMANNYAGIFPPKGGKDGDPYKPDPGNGAAPIAGKYANVTGGKIARLMAEEAERTGSLEIESEEGLL